MFWKILSGVLAMALLAVLLIDYVPALKKMLHSTEQINQALVDSLRAKDARQEATSKRLEQSLSEIQNVYLAEQRSQDRRASIVPTVTLKTQKLSPKAQRKVNLLSLINGGYLTASDTGGVSFYSMPGSFSIAGTQYLSYSPTEHTALTTRFQVCDSLALSDSLLRQAYADLQYRYQVRGDSSQSRRDWIEREAWINQIRGLFSGKIDSENSTASYCLPKSSSSFIPSHSISYNHTRPYSWILCPPV